MEQDDILGLKFPATTSENMDVVRKWFCNYISNEDLMKHCGAKHPIIAMAWASLVLNIAIMEEKVLIIESRDLDLEWKGGDSDGENISN